MKWKVSTIYDYYIIWRNKIEKTITNLFYFTKYYIHKIRTSYLYQKCISNYYGISIAKKINQTLKIKYIYDGNEYLVYIPFEKKYIHKMRNQSVVLTYTTHDQKIQQQPGVPYLITPKHIGAKSAKIHTIDGEHTIHENEKISIQ